MQVSLNDSLIGPRKEVNMNEVKLREQIKRLSKDYTKYKKDCIKQAKKYDTKLFIKKIKECLI